MNTKKKLVLLLFLVGVLTATSSAKKSGSARARKVETTEQAEAVLWRDPADIASRDLYFGPGGAAHEPHGTFSFVKEDLDGSNPKFTVLDENGVKWKVKLGSEARPETVASRLVWAVGFSADEDYFLSHLKVDDVTTSLHRGRNLMGPGGTFRNVRLKREPKKREKLGNWRWHRNPFTGTRELNGLRVLMAVINNWDLKDENNAVYQDKGDEDSAARTVYLVSDLGSSFGATGLEVNRSAEKGNLYRYRRSRFITSSRPEFVSFETPGRPAVPVIFNPHEFFSRLRMRWIGRNIPRSDARWIGQLLARLSHEQVRDAFRAAGYAPAEVEGFSQVLEQRISVLNRLAEDGDDLLLGQD